MIWFKCSMNPCFYIIFILFLFFFLMFCKKQTSSIIEIKILAHNFTTYLNFKFLICKTFSIPWNEPTQHFIFFLVMFDCKKEIINPELNNPHTFNPFVIENTVDSNQKSFLLASARLEQCVFTLLSTINHICHFFKRLNTWS